MIPVPTNQTNDVLLAGNNPNTRDLPIVRDPRSVSSTWQLTKEDVTAINANGGLITITVVGNTHPPLIMVVDNDVRKK